MLESTEKVVTEVEKFAGENSELLSDIGCVRGVTQYTVWLQLVEELNNELGAAMVGGNRGEMVKGFISIRDVDKELSGSKVGITKNNLILHIYFSACI